MCIIIDANVTGDLQPPSDDAKPVIDSIRQRRVLLVVGGKNTRELSINQKIGQWLRGLIRANVARVIPASDIKREEQILLELGQHESNDVHVLALARASGARLLFSRDAALGQDFKIGHSWTHREVRCISNGRTPICCGQRFAARDRSQMYLSSCASSGFVR